MIKLQAKNHCKKNPNPNHFIQKRSLTSSRHMQIAVVKLSSARSSTKRLPRAAAHRPAEVRGLQGCWIDKATLGVYPQHLIWLMSQPRSRGLILKILHLGFNSRKHQGMASLLRGPEQCWGDAPERRLLSPHQAQRSALTALLLPLNIMKGKSHVLNWKKKSLINSNFIMWYIVS